MAFGKKRYQTLDDNDLPRQYKETGNQEIIGEIYKRFGHLMFGTCLKYLKNKEEAEDCVMSIFEKMPGKLENHQIQHFKSWLYMVTKNACLMRLRKVDPFSDALPILEETLEGSNESGIDDKKLLEIKIEALNEAIDDLKDEQKETVKLFYIEQCSYAQISERLDMPMKKVKSAIQNGKRNIKMKLLDHVSFKSA